MKAAIIYPGSGMPQYADVPLPVATNEDELLISIKAAAVKHLDKSRANGEHYSAREAAGQPTIVGGDGVGLLADGTRVYAIGETGMLAEKAVIEKNRMVVLPAGIDDITAAALPNAVIGSAMGLRFRARMQAGETVLINGATGVTGKMAVQLAKYYGAKKVIATGRNASSLQSLAALGADTMISLQQEDDAIAAQIKAIHKSTPIDVIIDYLWGHPAELLLVALKGSGAFTPKTRFVSIGAMAGEYVQLSAANLRSADLQLSGSGLGSWTRDEVRELFRSILPEVFQLAAAGKLQVDTVSIALPDVANLWNMDIPAGKRLVVTI